jgi:hypothetical protein
MIVLFQNVIDVEDDSIQKLYHVDLMLNENHFLMLTRISFHLNIDVFVLTLLLYYYTFFMQNTTNCLHFHHWIN